MRSTLVLLCALCALSAATSYPAILYAGDLALNQPRTFTGQNLEVSFSSTSSYIVQYINVTVDNGTPVDLLHLLSRSIAKFSASSSVTFTLTTNVFTDWKAQAVVFYIVQKQNANDLVYNIMSPTDLYENGTALGVNVTGDSPLVMLMPADGISPKGFQIDLMYFPDAKGSDATVELLTSNDTYPLYTEREDESSKWRNTVVYGSAIRVRVGSGASATLGITPGPTSNWNNYDRVVDVGDKGIVMTASYQNPNSASQDLFVTLSSGSKKKLKFTVKIVSADTKLGNLSIQDAENGTSVHYGNNAAPASDPTPEGIVTSELFVKYTAQAGSKGLLLQYDVEKSSTGVAMFFAIVLSVLRALIA
uniref:Cadherin domain-containing protein n=1 Tax=Steinernema glaseri TaxID=37863 RepID=A0A1I7YG20_9BILA